MANENPIKWADVISHPRWQQASQEEKLNIGKKFISTLRDDGRLPKEQTGIKAIWDKMMPAINPELFKEDKYSDVKDTLSLLSETPRAAMELGAKTISGVAGAAGGIVAGMVALDPLNLRGAAEAKSIPELMKVRPKADVGAALAVGEGTAKEMQYKPISRLGKMAEKEFAPIEKGMGAISEFGREAIELPMQSWGIKRGSQLHYIGTTIAEIAPWILAEGGVKSISKAPSKILDVASKPFEGMKDIIPRQKDGYSRTPDVKTRQHPEFIEEQERQTKLANDHFDNLIEQAGDAARTEKEFEVYKSKLEAERKRVVEDIQSRQYEDVTREAVGDTGMSVEELSAANKKVRPDRSTTLETEEARTFRDAQEARAREEASKTKAAEESFTEGEKEAGTQSTSWLDDLAIKMAAEKSAADKLEAQRTQQQIEAIGKHYDDVIAKVEKSSLPQDRKTTAVETLKKQKEAKTTELKKSIPEVGKSIYYSMPDAKLKKIAEAGTKKAKETAKQELARREKIKLEEDVRDKAAKAEEKQIAEDNKWKEKNLITIKEIDRLSKELRVTDDEIKSFSDRLNAARPDHKKAQRILDDIKKHLQTKKKTLQEISKRYEEKITDAEFKDTINNKLPIEKKLLVERIDKQIDDIIDKDNFTSEDRIKVIELEKQKKELTGEKEHIDKTPIDYDILDATYEERKSGRESLGAAAEGDRGTKSHIQQLTESLENYPRKKLSRKEKTVDFFTTGLAEIGRLADTLSVLTGDALGSTGKALRSSGSLFAEAIRNPVKLKNEIIKKTTKEFGDFKRQLGDFLSATQLNMHYTVKFAKEVTDAIKDKPTREAITNYVQAGGDLKLLEERYKGSLANPKTVQYAEGYKKAMNLTPEQKIVAENVRQYYDSMLDDLVREKILADGVEKYVNQYWSKEEGKTIYNSLYGGAMDKNPSILKKRHYDSYYEGEQAGKTPRTKDIGSLIVAYSDSVTRVMSTRAMIETLKTCKAVDGRPLVAPTKYAKEVYADAFEGMEFNDYRTIDHSALQNHIFAGKKDGKVYMHETGLKIHPEAYGQLDAILGKSKLADSKIAKGAMRVSAEYKASLLSGIPTFFHQVHVGSHAAFRGVNPFISSKYDITSPLAVDAMKHGMLLKMDRSAMQYFTEGVYGDKSLMVQRIPFIGEISRNYGQYFFEKYLPALKLKSYESAVKGNMERYKGILSEAQIKEKSARQVEASFGELNYEWLGRSKTARDVFRLVGLAPDFLEARIRFAAGVFDPAGAAQRRALFFDTAIAYMGCAVINAVLNDGDFKWNDPFSFHYKGFKFSWRGIPQDAYHAFKDPSGFIANRLNPATVKPIITALTNRDQQGKYKDYAEQLEDYAKGAAPIALQGAFTDKDDALWQTLLKTVGMNAAVATTPFEKELKLEYAKKVAITIPRDERQQYSIMFNLADKVKRSMRYDDDKTTAEVIKSAEAEIKKHIEKGVLPQDAEDKVNELINGDRVINTTKNMDISTIMNVWDKASAAEKDHYMPLMIKKLANYNKKYSETEPDKYQKTEERFAKVFADQLKNLSQEQIDDYWENGMSGEK